MKFIKDHLLQHIAHDREHFFSLLRSNGFEVNLKHGVPVGIKDTNGKSYSWQKLGITPEDFYQLDFKSELHRINDRLHRLEEIRNGSREQNRDITF